MKSEIENLGSLSFLRSADDEDLQRLFEIVLTTNDSDVSLNHPSLDIWSCGILSILKDGVLDTHEKMLHKVVNELRLQSVSRFANQLHGEGPDYTEILRNVADKLTVPYSEKESDSEIESRILRQLSSKAAGNHCRRRECDLHEVVQSVTGVYVVTLFNLIRYPLNRSYKNGFG